MSDDERPQSAYASPACLMHEMDPAYFGLPPEPDPVQARDVARWRRAERTRLLGLRRALSPDDRRLKTAALADRLLAYVESMEIRSLGGFWPIRGEPDVRPLLSVLADRGIRTALPVVTEPATPLEFRQWVPGDPVERGFWDIPVPAAGSMVINPEMLIAPLVGFDRSGFRLGYGGGYFDRTMAVMQPRPAVIGIGFDFAEVPTIYPQPHDIPMSVIVTDIETLTFA